MSSASAKSPPDGQAGKSSWTQGRWLSLIALVLAGQVVLLFAFGGRKQIVPAALKQVPAFNLADGSDERLALNDPTLFALPHRRDFASASRPPTFVTNQPSFRWTEPTNWLLVSAGELGTVFNEFMQTNRYAGLELQLKPSLKLSTPGFPIEPVLAQTSTLLIEGDLVQRALLHPVIVPSLPYTDVIAPSRVQVLVDEAGTVVSTVLLPADDPLEAAGRYDDADRRALELARTARFAPRPGLTLGRLVFNWHTVPTAATNEPPPSP